YGAGIHSGFAQRLARLAGSTTYRMPAGGRGTKPLGVPNEHELAMALGMARRDADDASPDILFDLVTRENRHQQRVCLWLERQLKEASLKGRGSYAPVVRCKKRIPDLALCAYRSVTQSIHPGGPPAGISSDDWSGAILFACVTLEVAADAAARRASAA